jgi:hypothetical protein
MTLNGRWRRSSEARLEGICSNLPHCGAKTDVLSDLICTKQMRPFLCRATVGECKLHDHQSTADARWNLCYEVSI